MMNKAEFLDALKIRLDGLTDAEVEKTLGYYSEMIDDRVEDGTDENEAVSALGDIDAIAREVRLDSPLGTIIRDRVRDSKDRAKNKTLWLTLAICGSPFWAPVAIALAAAALALYIALIAVIIAIIVSAAAIAISGVAGVIGGIIRVFMNGPLTGLGFIGIGLCLIGAFLLLVEPVSALVRLIVRFTAGLYRRIKGLFIGKAGR